MRVIWSSDNHFKQVYELHVMIVLQRSSLMLIIPSKVNSKRLHQYPVHDGSSKCCFPHIYVQQFSPNISQLAFLLIVRKLSQYYEQKAEFKNCIYMYFSTEIVQLNNYVLFTSEV